MKRTFALAIVFVWCLAAPVSLFAWGDDGHNAIWEVAQSRLTPAAKAAVDKILAGDKPELTAVWMDRARDAARGKGGDLEKDAEAEAFNAKFKYNASWHYVDLPLGADSYEAAPDFHPYDSVVTMIRETMAVLEGQSQRLDQRTALRVIVHLIGDIHQPLHCASGFYDITDLQHPVLHKDVASCLPLDKSKCGDQGGNLIFFGPGTYDQLHAYWDIDAVKRVTLLQKPAEAVRKHLEAVDASTPGHMHDWPLRWAGESVKLAARAYEGIQFGACTPNTDPKKSGKISRIEIKLPDGYDDRSKVITSDQLAKAAIRLADVLNAILK